MLKRADRLERCGRSVEVRQCGDCGTDRPGSGRFVQTCKLRCCPVCSGIKASNVASFTERAFDAIDEVDGYLWQNIVLTTKYDPTREDEVSVEALRSRAFLAAKMARAAWDKMLKVAPGAALLRTIEVSPSGMVHANLVYYGPPVMKENLDEVTAIDVRAGGSNVQPIRPRRLEPAADECRDDEDQDGSKPNRDEERAAVKRAARYAAKGPIVKGASRREAWLGGCDDGIVEVLDPMLLARWEAATVNIHLLEKYGQMRGLKFDEDEQPEPEDDTLVACRDCGVVGHWKWTRRAAEFWIQKCRDAGKPALIGSVWSPQYADDG